LSDFLTILTPILTSNAATTAAWTPSEEQKKGLKTSLADFVTGLASFDSFQKDKFLVESLTNIVRTYLPRFSSSGHPLLPLLSLPPLPGLSLTSQQQLYQLTLSCLVATINKYLNYSKKHSSELVATSEHVAATFNAIQFISASFNKPVGQSRLSIIQETLVLLLEVASLTNDKSLQKEATKVLNDVNLEFCEKSGAGIWMNASIDAINTYVSRHVAFNSERVFVWLKVIGKRAPNLMKACFPSIESEVEKTEQKRGVGQDSRLRKHLADLKTHIL
jgi:hypothetical protein